MDKGAAIKMRASHLCNLRVQHQTSFELASRLPTRLASPVALGLQQPQCPTNVDDANLFAEENIGVPLQESELMADVYGTHEILISEGCSVVFARLRGWFPVVPDASVSLPALLFL